MANIELLKNKIAASSWSDLVKKQVTGLLPNLGQRTLDFLEARINRLDFELSKIELYISIFDGAEALANLQSGKTEEFITFLKGAQNSEDYNFGAYLIPLVLDVKNFLRLGKINSPRNLLEAIGEFELNVFTDLPEDEIKSLLGENLLYFMRRLDILKQFKILYLKKGSFDVIEWQRECLNKLENNKQLLGQRTLMLDNKPAEQSIQNWIKDAITNTPKGATNQSTFSEIQYVQKSRNVANLTIEERKLLMEVLKLHKWFLRPTTSIEDIEGSEIPPSENREPAMVTATQAVQRTVVSPFGQSSSASAPGLRLAAPLSAPAAARNSVPEQKQNGKQQLIDQKLKDLKQKLKK